MNVQFSYAFRNTSSKILHFRKVTVPELSKNNTTKVDTFFLKIFKEYFNLGGDDQLHYSIVG